MTTETRSLTAWLLECIAADEKAADGAGSFTPWDRDFQRDNYGHLTVQPSYVLATCAAHRAIVERADGPVAHAGQDIERRATLRDLASIYADREGYERWAL
jgi:hypothetical protein